MSLIAGNIVVAVPVPRQAASRVRVRESSVASLSKVGIWDVFDTHRADCIVAVCLSKPPLRLTMVCRRSFPIESPERVAYNVARTDSGHICIGASKQEYQPAPTGKYHHLPIKDQGIFSRSDLNSRISFS